MKNPFARREGATELPPVPDDVIETWRASTGEVVLRAELDAAPDDDRATADALSDLVLGIVRGVREGAFGHSMPADASGASVRIEVALCDDDYGPHTRHEAEDLVGRLAGVAPLAVVTYPRGGAAPVWDDGAGVLRVPLRLDLTGPGGEDDASTSAEVRALVQATLRAVTTGRVAGIVPSGVGEAYPIEIRLDVSSWRHGFAPLTQGALDAMQAQLATSRVRLTYSV